MYCVLSDSIKSLKVFILKSLSKHAVLLGGHSIPLQRHTPMLTDPYEYAQ